MPIILLKIRYFHFSFLWSKYLPNLSKLGKISPNLSNLNPPGSSKSIQLCPKSRFFRLNHYFYQIRSPFRISHIPIWNLVPFFDKIYIFKTPFLTPKIGKYSAQLLYSFYRPIIAIICLNSIIQKLYLYYFFKVVYW